jgi:hypothetical protein
LLALDPPSVEALLAVVGEGELAVGGEEAAAAPVSLTGAVSLVLAGVSVVWRTACTVAAVRCWR